MVVCIRCAHGTRMASIILTTFSMDSRAPSWIPYRFSSAAKPWNSNPLDPICINSKLARQTFVAQSKPRSCGKGLRGLTATDLRTSSIMNSLHYFGRIFDVLIFLTIAESMRQNGKKCQWPKQKLDIWLHFLCFVKNPIYFLSNAVNTFQAVLWCDCHTKLKITLLFDILILQPVWPFASRH